MAYREYVERVICLLKNDEKISHRAELTLNEILELWIYIML